MVYVVVVVDTIGTINVPTCVTHPSCLVIVMPIFPNGVMILKQVAASISRTEDVVAIATILTPNMTVTTSAVSVKSEVEVENYRKRREDNCGTVRTEKKKKIDSQFVEKETNENELNQHINIIQ